MFCLPVSFDKDVVSPSLEKLEYDHRKMERETKIIDFFHLHEYDCLWEASHKCALCLWHGFLLQLKNMPTLCKVGDSNIGIAEFYRGTVGYTKQCLNHIYSLNRKDKNTVEGIESITIQWEHLFNNFLA